MAFNSGIDQYKDTGALMYFGSDENLAGRAAGERIAADGAKHPLCVIQAAGSVALEARCAGVKSKASPAPRTSRSTAPTTPRSSRPCRPSSPPDKSIDYIVTLGAPIALDALKAMDAASSKAKLVTFDLNTEAAQAIKDGKIQFSVDQQPYVQGYLAVIALPEQEERQRHRWRAARCSPGPPSSTAGDTRPWSVRPSSVLRPHRGPRRRVLASDEFFLFPDGPRAALDAGVTAIIQPGGSRRDDEVVEAVRAAGATMVLTGRRHFRH